MASNPRMRKVTYSLPEDVVQAVRETVASGAYASQNEMVTAAVRRTVADIREVAIRRDLLEAMADPLYLEDMASVLEDFKYVDAEAALMVSE
jgi:Arc/MetJ-type ribon-helix-helix transcriptional regulator